MRKKKPLLDALFPRLRQAILGAVLPEPGRSWYLSDLASHLGRRSPSSLQRELESLVAAEILVRREEGNRVYFQANRECPIYRELASVLAKTAGLAEVVRSAMVPLSDRIRLAFIHGSIARSEEHAASDVDLLVLGEVGLAAVSLALRSVEDQLGRAVNAAVYPADEFAAKAAAGNHFLTAVLKREKLFLIGNEHDLEQLVAGGPATSPRFEQTGTG